MACEECEQAVERMADFIPLRWRSGPEGPVAQPALVACRIHGREILDALTQTAGKANITRTTIRLASPALGKELICRICGQRANRMLRVGITLAAGQNVPEEELLICFDCLKNEADLQFGGGGGYGIGPTSPIPRPPAPGAAD